MKKNTIRLTESQLHNIINESVKNVMNEAYGTPDTYTKKQLNGIDNENYSIKQRYNQVIECLHSFLGYCGGQCSQKQKDLIFKYTNNYIKNMRILMDNILNQKKQYYGEQPDNSYYGFHKPNHIYNGTYKPTPEELQKFRNGEDD